LDAAERSTKTHPEIGEMHLNSVLLFRILFWKRRECYF